MRLLYLSADNLRNTPLIKDLVFHYKGVGKSIILHDHFGSISDTRFVTKRISALLSEEMITNNAISGDQRNLLHTSMDGIQVRTELLAKALETVDVIVLNAVGLADGASKPLDPLAVAQQLRRAFGIETIHLFAKNSRSPMVAAPLVITSPDMATSLLEIYEEEANVLNAAANLNHVIIGSPSNFMASIS